MKTLFESRKVSSFIEFGGIIKSKVFDYETRIECGTIKSCNKNPEEGVVFSFSGYEKAHSQGIFRKIHTSLVSAIKNRKII